MDEETQKRNTDCVYFLASPLTCKKGNNCEFRHSEAARMNPRDCWYWIHSTCRNPNCSFRHPPLEGKPISCVPPQPAATTPVASTSSMPAAALASKSKTPCYFFSQGNCAKGDKCPFMHVPALPTTTDASPQQKPLKQPQGESGQFGNKPVVVLKSVTLSVKKPTASENVEKRSMVPRDSEPESLRGLSISAHDKPQIAKDLEKAKVLGSSVTTKPYRTEKEPGGRKSRVTLFSDTPTEFLTASERPQNVHAIVDKRQGHPARKQPQSEHEHLHSHLHSLQGADRRYQNGSRGDAWWKNDTSSLDNDGSDQSIQREDGEYSPPFASRGRAKVNDDSTSRTFKGLQSRRRDEFNCVPTQHRQIGYLQHREQQIQHESDYNGTTDHSRHHGVPSGTRISARDGERMVSEGYTSSVDLRDHLKRRRDGRAYQPRSESLSRRAPSNVVETPVNQRRDDGFIQKDQHGRVPLRGVDHRGIKRLRHDGGASPDGRSSSRISPIRRLGPGRSPDRALPVESPSRHSVVDYSRSESRERGRDRYASKTASAVDIRSHSASSRIMKSEYTKDDTGFAAPKSLAQIKAEKEAEANARVTQGRNQKSKPLEESVNLAESKSAMQANHQDLVASSSKLKRLHAEDSSSSKRESKSVISVDFEGPKPLSELLKEKHKLELGSSIDGGMVALKKTEDVLSDSNREMEDGEVRDEEDDWKDDPSNEGDSPIVTPQEEIIRRPEYDHNMEEPLEADHSQGVADDQDDMGSPDDGVRLEIGQIMSGDEDYELDDEDDDDFAKKLGGFFS